MRGRMPEQVGPYRVVRHLARGGTADIFEAVPHAGGPHVAIKRANTNRRSKRALETEYTALCSVQHQGIVRAHTLAEDHQSRSYMVADLLQGVSALQFARDLGTGGSERRTTGVIGILADICDSVHALHHAGWVHRDIKSSNIVLMPSGHSVLVDLGAAIPLQSGPRRGGFIGTRSYAPPEQLLGQAVDERADVYAIGVLAYRMLTGQRPYNAEDNYRSLQLKLYQPLPALRSHCPLLPEAAATLLQRALHPTASERPRLPDIRSALSLPYGSVDSATQRGRYLLAILACAHQPVSSEALQWIVSDTSCTLYNQLIKLMRLGLIRCTRTGWRVHGEHAEHSMIKRLSPEQREVIQHRLRLASLAPSVTSETSPAHQWRDLSVG